MPAENYPLYLTFSEQPRVCSTKPVDEKASALILLVDYIDVLG